MQLVQRGSVKLDAPLARYVPGFSLRPRFHDSVITVQSALDHHSGIPGNLFSGLFTENRPNPGYRAWLLKTLRTEYPQRPVNTAWAYDNSAYALLQNLVEHVTGEGFAAYTRQHLFGPMGMRSTTYDDVSVQAGRLTHNYEAVRDNGTMRVIPKPREYVNGWAAGSVVSSATDMAAYLETMIAGGAAPGGRILRASTLRQMITPQTNLPLDIAPFRMGLGWWVGESALSWMGTAIHHAGHTLANDSEVMWLPGSKLGVFVSVNTHSPVDVERQVAVLALGLMVTAKTGRTAPAPPRPAPPVHVAAAVLRRAAGRYANAGGIELVQAGRGVLLLTPASQRPDARSVTLTPRADGWYTEPSGAISIKPVTVAGRGCWLVGPRMARSPPPLNVSRPRTASRPPGVTALATTARSTSSPTPTPVRSRTTPPSPSTMESSSGTRRRVWRERRPCSLPPDHASPSRLGSPPSPSKPMPATGWWRAKTR